VSALDGVSGAPYAVPIGEQWPRAVDCPTVDTSSYIGLIGALLGSALTGLFALLLDRQRGNREREAARDQRDFDERERRYQGRLDAYSTFEAKVSKHLRTYGKLMPGVHRRFE
jgi:hypothetical protein